MVNKKLKIVLISVIFAVIILPTSALAHHYVWLVYDDGKQLSFSGDESRISWWMMNGLTTSYQIDSAIDTEVEEAISNWNSAVPEVKISGSGDELDFQYSDSICSGTAVACHSVVAVYNDSVREANFNTKSRIVVTSNSPNFTRSTAHEIGHYLGFHEQYVDVGPTQCNNSIYSVMDSSSCDIGLEGPSSTDVFRIDNFLGNGTAENISTSVSNNNAYIVWKDKSMGEYWYEISLQKNQSGTWTTKTTKFTTAETGLIAGLGWKSDETINEYFGLSTYGSGTYRVKIAPYFRSYSKYGITTYSSNFSY